MTAKDFRMIAAVLNERWNFERHDAIRIIDTASRIDRGPRQDALLAEHRIKTARIAMIGAIVDHFAADLAGTNPRFDRDRFLAACFALR